ncbi:hypothetical protein D515_04545 [Grimontia indica]|uniref:Lipoprotein n=1 Tax=Grimontia indica TaxID=1056512 RepID=R1IK08_9GAMM|nr:DUF2799 domain-containing protein [Grimontia indica]EOD81051.1 hypothetical protein D515_04545 [Grimontia indica]
MKKLMVLLPVLLAAGCTSTSTLDLAQNQDWTGLAERDVSLQLPKRSNESLAELGANDMGEKEVYLTSYESSKEQFCDPSRAFKMGFMGERYDGFCDDRNDGWIFYQNWNIGRGSSQMDHFPF